MEQPPFSTFENYSENPYPEALPGALRALKDLANNNEVWQYPQEKEDVKLQQFSQDGDLIPIVRGDGSISGYSVEEILSVIRNPSCRAVWDVRYESGLVIETYDRHTAGFWAVQKGSGYFVWPRDFTGLMGHVQEKEGNDATSYYFVQVSAAMKKVPEFAASYVRGTLSVAGFILRNGDAADKVDLTYIVKADPAGYIPSSLVAMVAVETPMGIARIREYLVNHGFAPYIPIHAEPFHGVLQRESYDRDADSLDVRWKPEDAGSFNVYYDKTRWLGGAHVVAGEDTSEDDFRISESEGKVTITFEADVKGRNLQVFVKKAA